VTSPSAATPPMRSGCCSSAAARGTDRGADASGSTMASSASSSRNPLKNERPLPTLGTPAAPARSASRPMPIREPKRREPPGVSMGRACSPVISPKPRSPSARSIESASRDGMALVELETPDDKCKVAGAGTTAGGEALAAERAPEAASLAPAGAGAPILPRGR
jgi:hypothetical protein